MAEEVCRKLRLFLDEIIESNTKDSEYWHKEWEKTEDPEDLDRSQRAKEDAETYSWIKDEIRRRNICRSSGLRTGK